MRAASDQSGQRVDEAEDGVEPRAQLAVGGAGWRVNIVAIERARILRGWSKDQLARTAKVDPKTVRNMIAGRHRPTLGTVVAIGRALGVELSRIIEFHGVS